MKRIWKEGVKKIRSLFAEEVYGTWLLRKWASCGGYVVLFFVSLGFSAYCGDGSFLRAESVSEIIIGVYTILLALLIPIVIMLMEGDSKAIFVRQTIIREIIRFKGHLVYVVLLLVCISLVIVSSRVDIGIKSTCLAVLTCCTMFMVSIFYRAVCWLCDYSSYSLGIFSDGEAEIIGRRIEKWSYGSYRIARMLRREYPPSSYRFARIVQFLRDEKKPQPWVNVWQQQLPYIYESIFYQEFIGRQLARLKKRKEYENMRIELEAYFDSFSSDKGDDRYFVLSTVGVWELLHLYVEVGKISHARNMSGDENDRTCIVIGGIASLLWHMNIRTIANLLKKQQIEQIVAIIDEYVKTWAIKEEVPSDSLPRALFDILFSAIAKGNVDINQVGKLGKEGEWSITSERITANDEGQKAIALLINDAYLEWFIKIMLGQNTADYSTSSHNLLRGLFPGVDLVLLSELHWILYVVCNEAVARNMHDIVKDWSMIREFLGSGTHSDNPEERRATIKLFHVYHHNQHPLTERERELLENFLADAKEALKSRAWNSKKKILRRLAKLVEIINNPECKSES